jgi:light-regulated signal transduction histidine kinase (bacteriophytochrome)
MVAFALHWKQQDRRAFVYRSATRALEFHPEQAAHIFDRFFQVDTDGYQQGSGIGLAIVKELVELQNGTIRLDSDLNGFKTVFAVSLPYLLTADGQTDKTSFPNADLVKTESYAGAGRARPEDIAGRG